MDMAGVLLSMRLQLFSPSSWMQKLRREFLFTAVAKCYTGPIGTFVARDSGSSDYSSTEHISQGGQENFFASVDGTRDKAGYSHPLRQQLADAFVSWSSLRNVYFARRQDPCTMKTGRRQQGGSSA